MSMLTSRCAALILGMVLGSLSSGAQESRGIIAGRVTDPSGAVVAGVDVRATNQQSGVVAAARTNDAGNYTIPYLVPGVYTVSATFAGFKKTEKPGIEVRVGDMLNVEL